MSALFYILRRQLINIIRSMARKPLVLIGYIFIGIFFVGFVLLAFLMPSGMVHQISGDVLTGILTALIIIALYFSLRQGIEKGSTYFRLSDVNYAFAAPIRPNQILLYGFIKNMGTSLLIVLFTVFQIPNIKNHFMLQSYGVWVLLMTVLLYSLLNPVLGMILYIGTAEHKNRRVLAKRVLDGLFVLFILGGVPSVLRHAALGEALIEYLNGNIFSFVPFAGQLRGIASAAINGVDAGFFISLFILVGAIAAFLVILYRKNLDYYEDVLVATEYSEQRIKEKREGRGANIRLSKIRKVKGGFTASGAAVIFQKHLLEYRKTSLFLFVDKATIAIILASIAFKYLMPNQMGSIFITLFFSVYMLFLFIIQGRWTTELDKPYIFLIPESNGKKLLFATMTENIKNLLDGTLLFCVAYFVYETSLVSVVLCMICYTLFGAIFIYADILSRRLFGSVHSKAMQVFIKLFVSLFVIAPGIILMIVFSIMTKNEALSLLAVMAWNFLVAMGLFFAAQGIFKDIQMN